MFLTCAKVLKISDAQVGRKIYPAPYKVYNLPFSSGEGSLAAEAEPLVPSLASMFWSVEDLQDLLRPRWESKADGSPTYCCACSLRG